VRAARRALALTAALVASAALPGAADAAVREVWVAAVPITWNIAPNGHDAIEHVPLDPARTRIRTVVYRQFTRNWGRPLGHRGQLGILGPLIRGRVGDRFVVHFRNRDTLFRNPHSMHFHGVHYRFGADGSYIPGFTGRGADVRVGQSYTYRFTAGKDSRGVWPYHDHSPSMMASLSGGMYGALSILGRHERAPDREFVVYFTSLNGFDTINGRAFVGNTPVYHGQVGDRVQWDVLTLGDAHHTFHVHGHRWRRADGVPEDTRTLGPAESFAVRWQEDVPGTWLYHCHVESHMMNGMIGLYRVRR
jgi:FtsP/CotA-like multicopper oxidase with cupredoxin domain